MADPAGKDCPELNRLLFLAAGHSRF